MSLHTTHSGCIRRHSDSDRSHWCRDSCLANFHVQSSFSQSWALQDCCLCVSSKSRAIFFGFCMLACRPMTWYSDLFSGSLFDHDHLILITKVNWNHSAARTFGIANLLVLPNRDHSRAYSNPHLHPHPLHLSPWGTHWTSLYLMSSVDCDLERIRGEHSLVQVAFILTYH